MWKWIKSLFTSDGGNTITIKDCVAGGDVVAGNINYYTQPVKPVLATQRAEAKPAVKVEPVKVSPAPVKSYTPTAEPSTTDWTLPVALAVANSDFSYESGTSSNFHSSCDSSSDSGGSSSSCD